MNEASAARHLENMQEKHRMLEKSIHVEESRPSPDTCLIHRLKVQKLRIKDAMASFISKIKK
jgi:hypothetical protein